MKNNTYESAVIINAALEDEQIEQIISRIKETINGNGGELRDTEDWGRKRLAYVIKKSKIGYYVFFRFDAPSTIVSKLERFYTLDEQIIRYLTLKLSIDALQHIESKKAASVSEEPLASEEEVSIEVEENSEIKDEK